ncbi:MAG: hypothetical protein L6R00_18590 [Phycisphaerae bacterium]|nr:hypothetical protein [Phycisphaerae bacterium]
MTGERPDLGRFTRAVNSVCRQLGLRPLERLIVDDPERLIPVHDMAVLIRPPRHTVPRGAVQFEAAPQVADFTDEHPVCQDAADRPESPRPAEPRRHAALTHAAGDFLEADRLGQVGLKDEAHRLRLLGMNREPLLPVGGLHDAIAVGRRPAGPAAFLVPLHEPLAGPLGEHAAVVGGDDELHATRQRVRPLGDAHHFDAVLLQVFDEDVRLRRPAEAVVLVDVELVDPAGFGFLHEPQKLGPAARGASGFRLVDEVLERPARRTLAGLDLHGDARAVVLGMAGVPGVEGVVLAAARAALTVPTASCWMPLCRDHSRHLRLVQDSTACRARGGAPLPVRR